MAHRCAILDDYQNVATKLADWSMPRTDQHGDGYKEQQAIHRLPRYSDDAR